VERLLGVIYNENSRVVRSGLSAQAGASEDNPIGNLSDAQLDLGGEILDEIAAHLAREIGPETDGNKSRTLPLFGGVPIIDLTNRFMSNVPRSIPSHHRGRANLHHVVVSSYERLEEQRKFLTLLRDAHLAKATFAAAAAAGPSAHSKVGVWYDGLQCEVEFCERGSADFRRVNEIFMTGQSRKNANFYGRGGRTTLRVANVWRFTRKGTSVAFDKYAAKVFSKRGAVGIIQAWHGTRRPNLLGISKSGLLMPEDLPRGVYKTGTVFGKGIYHAPNHSHVPDIEGYRTDGTNGALKSMNYTGVSGAAYGGNNQNSAFLFLQDVALGRGDVWTTPCWDRQRPRDFPNKDFIYANAGGCSTLAHDEIVTFSRDAQIFRYLLEIKVA